MIIGNWSIEQFRDGKLWIADNRSGEGGEFDEAKVAEAVEKFFEENF